MIIYDVCQNYANYITNTELWKVKAAWIFHIVRIYGFIQSFKPKLGICRWIWLICNRTTTRKVAPGLYWNPIYFFWTFWLLSPILNKNGYTTFGTSSWIQREIIDAKRFESDGEKQ